MLIYLFDVNEKQLNMMKLKVIPVFLTHSSNELNKTDNTETQLTNSCESWLYVGKDSVFIIRFLYLCFHPHFKILFLNSGLPGVSMARFYPLYLVLRGFKKQKVE